MQDIRICGSDEPVRIGVNCSLLAHSEAWWKVCDKKGTEHPPLREHRGMADVPLPVVRVCAIEAHSSMKCALLPLTLQSVCCVLGKRNHGAESGGQHLPLP